MDTTYTGGCAITAMIWNAPGNLFWERARTVMVTMDGEPSDEPQDIRDIAMSMLDGEFPSFYDSGEGPVAGGNHSFEEFIRSWDECAFEGDPAADAAALEERLDVAATMYHAQWGEVQGWCNRSASLV